MLKKTDGQLQRDVMDELEWEPSVDHADIGVAVTDGVVTLSGYVKTYPEKIAAEKATRRVAGVGYPQLSAIAECADAAHGLGGHIMSDGGCAAPGDIAKAFGAGADFVMLGGMLAGHDESGGELVEQDGRQFKSFYGMSSRKAMEEYFGEVAAHRAPEGKEVRVPYRGSVEPSLQAILGGLRSACSYVGAWRIKDLPKCTTFVRVTRTTNNVYEQFDVDD